MKLHISSLFCILFLLTFILPDSLSAEKSFTITLVRDIGGDCGNAALDVVESMNNMPEKWIPGKQKGAPVSVKYTLPVKFKLEDSGVKNRN